MAKGGARSRSGPAPEPSALRRDRDGGDWVSLPPPRKGRAPAWPLTRQTKREAELWKREWSRPQAVMWQAAGQELEVAIYVRTLREAERARAPTTLRTLLRQQMDALGLTIPGLRANRWRIGTDSGPVARSPVRRSGGQPTAKERLRLLAGGG